MLIADDLGVDGGEALLDLRLPILGLLLSVRECCLDQVCVAIEAGELVDDGALEFLAREPLVAAGFRPVFLAAGAGVVVVEAAVATCAHADVGLATSTATQHAGEQELARVPAPPGDVSAALIQDRLREREDILADEWFVDGVEELVAPADLAGVGRVVEDEVDGRVSPACGGCRCLFGAELFGDLDGAEPVMGVEIEDPPDDRRLDRVGDQAAFLVGEGVAERRSAGVPAALLRAAFDAGADAVDDRGVLELGEHAEHLQHHPPSSRAGVERLGRGAEDDVELVEFLRELRQLPDFPGEPVDAVDEQHVYQSAARQIEGGLQAGPVELGAGRAVLLVGDDAPPLLRLTERLQPLPLTVQRRRLVLLIGRDPRVETDPDHRDTTSSLSSLALGSSIEPSIPPGCKSPAQERRPAPGTRPRHPSL
ncbi:MAG TPA: hypothetical protein VNC40_10390 [Gaiellaceae bacterium]|nr:hypothetical protein [Gaiellaceae bacterium]